MAESNPANPLRQLLEARIAAKEGFAYDPTWYTPVDVDDLVPKQKLFLRMDETSDLQGPFEFLERHTYKGFDLVDFKSNDLKYRTQYGNLKKWQFYTPTKPLIYEFFYPILQDEETPYLPVLNDFRHYVTPFEFDDHALNVGDRLGFVVKKQVLRFPDRSLIVAKVVSDDNPAGFVLDIPGFGTFLLQRPLFNSEGAVIYVGSTTVQVFRVPVVPEARGSATYTPSEIVHKLSTCAGRPKVLVLDFDMTTVNIHTWGAGIHSLTDLAYIGGVTRDKFASYETTKRLLAGDVEGQPRVMFASFGSKPVVHAYVNYLVGTGAGFPSRDIYTPSDFGYHDGSELGTKNMMLAEIARRYSLEPQDVYLIDDSEKNVRLAIGAGYRGFQVTGGALTDEAWSRIVDALCKPPATGGRKRTKKPASKGRKKITSQTKKTTASKGRKKSTAGKGRKKTTTSKNRKKTTGRKKSTASRGRKRTQSR